MKKFLLYAFTYILMTVSVAFGTVAIDSLTATGSTGSSSTVAQAPVQETAGDKLLNNLLTMGGAEVEISIQLFDSTKQNTIGAVEEVELQEILPDIDITFIGNINISSLDDIKLNGTINLKMQDTSVSLDIAFLNNTIYVSNKTLNIKLETSSISKVLELLPVLGINLDIGLDMEEINVNDLMGALQNIKEEKVDEDTLKLTLNLFESFSIDILCDNDYNVTAIEAKKLAISNYLIDINAGLEQNAEVEIESPEETQEKEYVDVTKTLNIVDSVKEIVTNEKLHLNIDAGLIDSSNEITVIGAVDVDFSNEIQVYANLNLSLDGAVHNLQVGYLNSNVYITFNGLKFMVNDSAITETINVISKHFNLSNVEQNVLLEIAKIIPGFELDDVLNGNFSNISIDNLLEFSKGEDNVVNITVFGEALNISSDIKVAIALDENDQFSSLALSGIQLLEKDLYAVIEYTNEVTIPEVNNEDYLNFNNLPNFVDAIIATVKDVTETKLVELNINLNVVVGDVTIAVLGDLVIDFTNENIFAYANLNLTVLEKTINLKLQVLNNVIYVDIENLKLSYAISDVEELIDLISSQLEISTLSSDLNSLTSLLSGGGAVGQLLQGNLSAITSDLIKELNIVETNAYIVLNKTLLNTADDIKLTINYGEQLEGVALTGINFNSFGITLNANFTSNVQIPGIVVENYIDLKYTKNLVSAILSTIDEYSASETLALDVNANITFDDKFANLSGTVAIGLSDVYANLTITIDEIVLPVEMYLVENEIYLKVEELKVFTTIDNISQIVSLFGDNAIDVTKLLGQVFPLFDFEQIENGNLSSISLDILKSLSINKTNTVITLSNEYIGSDTDITLKLNYIDNLQGLELSGVNMFGIGLGLNANLNYDFEIPTLNPNGYNNLSHLYEAVNSILNTVNTVMENKELALNLNLNATIEDVKYNISGLIYVNFANATTLNENEEQVFDVNGLVAHANINLNLNGTTISIYLNVQNGYTFVEYSNFKIKIQIESIVELVELVTSMIPEENQQDVKELLNTYLGESVLTDILNEDYSTISLSLIKSITTSTNGLNIVLDKTLLNSSRDVIINITYNDVINFVDVFNLNISNIKLQLNAQLNYDYKPTQIDESTYFELSGADSLINSILNTVEDITTNKVVALNLNNLVVYLESQDIHISGYIYIDFANAITTDEEGQDVFDVKGLYLYADLNIKIFDKASQTFNDYEHNISVLFDGTNIYAKYNTLKISIAASSINEVIEVITKLMELNASEVEEVVNFDIAETLQEIFPGIDFETLLAGDLSALDLNIIKYLNIIDDSTTLTLNKDVLGIASDIILGLTYGETLNGVTLSGVNAFDISLDLNATLLYNQNKPTVVASEYSNLDNIADLMDSVYNTGVEVNENKNIAFGLNTNIVTKETTVDDNDIPTEETTTTIILSNSSFAKFDWSNAYDIAGDMDSFNIEKLNIYAYLNATVLTSKVNYKNGVIDESTRSENISTHEIEITYINNVVYLRYNNMKVKIDGEGIGLTIDTICELLGLEISTNSFDNLLGLITSASQDNSMLDKIKVEMIKSISLTDTKLSTTIDIAPLELGFGEEFNILNLEVIYNSEELEFLSIKDLSVMGLNINNLTIGLTEFTPVEVPSDAGYMNMSSIGILLEAVKNTLDFTDFTIQGNVKLKLNVIGINIDWNIPLSIQLKLVEGSFEAKIVMGPVPVIGGVNDDAPYVFGNTISGINPGENRILTIYMKDNFAYFHRSESVPVFASSDKIYEKKLKVHMETLLDDPLYYLLQYGLGFSDSIMNAITSSLASERVNPIDYSNILVGYTDNGNGLYTLTLNLVELTENTQLDTMSVGVKVVEHNGKNIVGGLTFNMYMPVADGVEITLNSDDLTNVNVGKIIDFSDIYSFASTYSYKEGSEWDAYDGDWQLSGQRKFTLSFVTNSAETIISVEGIAGSRFVLPTPKSWTVDNGVTCTTYEFAGWYTTKTFDAGTEYTENIMPRSNKTIYAKWNALVSKYVTITLEENGGATLEDIKILEGANLILPSYLDLLIVETDNAIYTKQFDGWFVDAECTIEYSSNTAPTTDITLYALWTTVDMAETYELSVYDNGEKIATKYLFEGSTISLSGSAKFNSTTKYYTDSAYTTEYTSMIMPDSNFELHIKNEYSLTLISNFGKVVNSKFTYYQGYTVTIPSQQTYSYDDGTQTECITYKFNGYYVDGVNVGNLSEYVMPNKNVTIEASWTVDTKVYFTVTFNTSFKKPGSWNVDSGVWGTMTEVRAPSSVTSVRVLEGQQFNPDPNIYKTTCRYKYKAVGISKEYEFAIKAWNTTEPKQLSYNSVATSAFTEDYTPEGPITITDDTILYPVWYYVG